MKTVSYTRSELERKKSYSLSVAEIVEKSAAYDEDSPEVTELLDRGVIRPVGRPRKAERKETISIRLDPDTLRRLRAKGPGWQSALRRKISEWA